MKYWLVISNNSFFRLDDYLEGGRSSVTWRQTNNFEVGDKVFIYTTAPKCCISYEMNVAAVELTAEHFTDEEAFWVNPDAYLAAVRLNRFCEFKLEKSFHPESMPLRLLKLYGFVATRGNMVLEGQLLEFILSTIDGSHLNGIESTDNSYPTEVNETGVLNEGAVMQVTVNRYERNREAREQCVEAKGCQCAVCGIDFEAAYGEIGQGFIHVHHLIPISSIGEDYVIDPIRHLVPVCPNCHNMLHRKDPPYTVEEMKGIIQSRNSKMPRDWNLTSEM